jgi:hypothetical protein
MQMKHQFIGPTPLIAKAFICIGILVFTLTLVGMPVYGDGSNTGEPSPMGTSVAGAQGGKDQETALSEIAAKLANPVSDIWALFTEFDLYSSDGNLNRGKAKLGGRMTFEPIMPFPLYGTGEKEWKLITRPSIPIVFSQPAPTGFDEFSQRSGLGDIQLPMIVSPPLKNWVLGFGPCWLLPTATDNALGRQQWGVGPTAVFGYRTKDWTAIALPQYYFGIGSTGGRSDSTPTASYLNLLYAIIYNLPDAWQIGFNPTITYDSRASSGNQWNVPVGFFVAKTIRIGRVPVKFQLGLDYSVVSQDDFGQKWQVKLNIIPVIPALLKNPIFGGE